MALTVTLLKDGNDFWGRTKVQHASLALDNSYPTGGYSLPSSKFGMRALFNFIIGNMGVSGVGAYRFAWDSVNSKLMVYVSAGFTPAGTVAAPTFTGTALAAHRHVLHFQTSAAANAVTAATNQLRTAAAAFDVAGVANSAGEGGVVDVTAGTPAGTNSAPAFTGTAVAAGLLAQVANGVDLSAITALYVTALGR